MAKFNIREQDPQKYSAVKAEQDKLSAICGVQMKIARICPYCGHTVSIVYKGDHTFTTRMCEAGVNVKVIQDTLGHKDISTTLNIYTDVTKELKRSEFEGLDLYFKAE